MRRAILAMITQHLLPTRPGVRIYSWLPLGDVYTVDRHDLIQRERASAEQLARPTVAEDMSGIIERDIKADLPTMA